MLSPIVFSPSVFPGGTNGKEPACQCRRRRRRKGHRFDPWVEKIPWRKAWQPTLVVFPGESPWTEEPGRLQSMGSQRAEHDRATKHSTHGIYTWFPSVSTNSQVAQLVHSVCQCRRCKRCWYDPGRSPGEGNGNPLQYFLPGKFHGQRSLAAYSTWGCRVVHN